MKVGLFIPCYVDQFYPQVGMATLKLLESFGVDVHFPTAQTCCGQPMANSGCEQDAHHVYHHFVETFAEYDFIVSPSGSCVYHVRKHYDVIDQTQVVKAVRGKCYELVQFLVDVLGVEQIDGYFPFQVGLHVSCHGQRGLRQGTASEITPAIDNATVRLLSKVEGVSLTALDRVDECCGFGGTFCVTEEAVSARMGVDRIGDHLKNGTQVLTGNDVSCLMHLEGIIRRKKIPIRVMHISELLYEALVSVAKRKVGELKTVKL